MGSIGSNKRSLLHCRDLLHRVTFIRKNKNEWCVYADSLKATVVSYCSLNTLRATVTRLEFLHLLEVQICLF